MRRSNCPGNRRGHSWKAVTAVPPALASAHPAEVRECARCGCFGKITKQGIVKEVT
jgi:hypothetical protein